MNPTIEVNLEDVLPEGSVVKQILTGDNPDVKAVEKTMSDEEYGVIMAQFLEMYRKKAEDNKPQNKIKKKIAEKENERKRAQFKTLKPGFLL
jgi:hypothetical protein